MSARSTIVVAAPQSRQHRADRLFAASRAGTITAPAVTPFPLARGADAHRLLEDRSFAGKIVLLAGQPA
jgi:hypothetical protein